jgi:hypothetical protein
MTKIRSKDGKKWDYAEVSFLTKHMEMDVEDVASHLGRSVYAVMSMKTKIKRGYEVPDDEYIPTGALLTRDEKVSRIYKMAADMRVRLMQ